MAEFGFLAAIAVRTMIVLIVLVIGLRLTGKRRAGELNQPDLILVLVLANAVQNAMTNGDGRLTVALVSAGTLIACGWIFAWLVRINPSVHQRLNGSPTVVVENGRALRQNLRREGVTREELLQAVREKGLADLADVRLAILEPDGTISIIPQEEARVA
jgi:uncharacterized membrane protein YcaP (DUF421 family)